jgi:hypothetical protein
MISGQETATITAITAEKRKHGLGVASESKEAMVESDEIRKRATGYAGTGGRSKWTNRVQRDPHNLSSDGREDW